MHILLSTLAWIVNTLEKSTVCVNGLNVIKFENNILIFY